MAQLLDFGTHYLSKDSALMYLDQSLLQNIVNLLSQTLNPLTQRQGTHQPLDVLVSRLTRWYCMYACVAEDELKNLETSTANFAQLLLAIAEGSFAVLEVHVRMAAALLLKNFVRRHWALEVGPLTEVDRTIIKACIVEMLTKVSVAVQRQLCEIVTVVAALDFPEAWPDLINQLVGKLNAAEFDNNLAILRTLHHMFKRYRTERKSDELYTEINYVLEHLAMPLLEFYKAADVLAEANSTNRTILEKIVRAQIFLNKIFYSLSSQDLPAFFEDHLTEFMGLLKKQILFKNPILDSTTEDEAGPSEKLPCSVVKIAILYATKYEEDFAQLNEFVETVWTVLTSLGRARKDDALAGACMRLLSSVAKQERHKALFCNVLQLLCDKVIVPNALVRESDLEMFEDEPLEYVRTIIDAGLEDEGRRAGAISLVRGLMEFYEVEITNILQMYIGDFLKVYSTAPAQNWRDKDAAVSLFGAIAVKGSVTSLGVTRVNSLVNIEEFFSQNIVSDLQPSNAALHPLLKVDAIRFVSDFRSQLAKDQLLAALPLLQHHLISHNIVVHSAAAIALDKVLSVKRQGVHLFTGTDIASFADSAIQSLVRLVIPGKGKKIVENEFAMKAILRMILTAQSEILGPIVDVPLDNLTMLVGIVAANPVNPIFNHSLFECLAALTRFTGSKHMGKLISPLVSILRNNQNDFIHYVFQLFAVALESRQEPSIPDEIQSLLPAVLQPVLWTASENIPALSRFLQAVMVKDPKYFASNNLPPQVLGIFQALMGSKVHDTYAFALLDTFVQSMPMSLLESFLNGIIVVLMKKLQTSKNPRMALNILIFICILAIQHSSSSSDMTGTLIRQFDILQPGLFMLIMTSILLPNAPKIRDRHDRKIVLVGLIKIATDCPLLVQQPDFFALFVALVGCIITMLTNLPSGGLGDAQEAFEEDSSDEVALGSASFWKLRYSPPPRKCPYIETLPDASVIFISSLAALSRTQAPNHVAHLLNNLDSNLQSSLATLLQRSNTSI